MSSFRRLAAPVLAVLAAMIAAGSAHAAPVAGINVNAYSDATVAVADGAKQVRFFVPWRNFEPGSADDFTSKGPARPSPLVDDLKTYVGRVRAAGATPIMVVLDAPDWASGGGSDHKHPRNPAEYAAFVGELSTWLRDDAAPSPVYEVWNEPDASTFWGTPPDADAYTALLKAAYPAIKGADPSATVLTGPTTGNNYAWIESLYARGAKGSFDGISVHTDTACSIVGPDTFYREANGRLGQYSFLAYREIRAAMLANGDGAKGIWMTEIGWVTSSKLCASGESAGKKPVGVSEADQAAFLTRGFQCMARDPYVVAADWFTLRDDLSNPADEVRYGLLGDAGPKPSLAAFRAAGSQAPAECGDFTPPTLNVVSPKDGQQFYDKLDLSASATDPGSGIARIAYAFDGGKGIRNFTDALKDGTPVGLAPWQGSGVLSMGAHTVEVTATDKLGNVTSKVVKITKVPVSKLVAAAAPTAKLAKKPTCKKVKGVAVCSFTGRLVPTAGGPTVTGKITIAWYWKNKAKKFRKLVGGSQAASKPFKFTAKLKKKGTWRMRVTYKGVAPYKSYTSKYFTFKVK